MKPGGASDTAQDEEADVFGAEMPEALTQLDPLWNELFPAEQERIA